MGKKKYKTIAPMNQDHKIVDDRYADLVRFLFTFNLVWPARSLLRIVRLKWQNRSIQTENESEENATLPTGPYLPSRNEQKGDLLLWVPRSLESYVIDDLTGGYGYSHATIDSGEIDMLTQKPVMIEVTVGEKVTRKFQDHFKKRFFVRVPISKTGVNPEQFTECVKSKIGEPYDVLEIFSLGKMHDPAKEVCSGLAADCLPDRERQRIVEAKRLGMLRPTSVSISSIPGSHKQTAAISPNGFAQYYGAPKGRKLNRPNVLVVPHPKEGSKKPPQPWKVAAVISASLIGLIILFYN